LQERALSDTGLGHYVMPKKNRLVLLKQGTFHKISRIDDNAGATLRGSIAGFFVKT
jgi:hypothetical protein